MACTHCVADPAGVVNRPSTDYSVLRRTTLEEGFAVTTSQDSFCCHRVGSSPRFYKRG